MMNYWGEPDWRAKGLPSPDELRALRRMRSYAFSWPITLNPEDAPRRASGKPAPKPPTPKP